MRMPTNPEQNARPEQCTGCGAVLVEDQRYCLQCGARHGKPRLDFTAFWEPLSPTDSADERSGAQAGGTDRWAATQLVGRRVLPRRRGALARHGRRACGRRARRRHPRGRRAWAWSGQLAGRQRHARTARACRTGGACRQRLTDHHFDEHRGNATADHKRTHPDPGDDEQHQEQSQIGAGLERSKRLIGKPRANPRRAAPRKAPPNPRKAPAKAKKRRRARRSNCPRSSTCG